MSSAVLLLGIALVATTALLLAARFAPTSLHELLLGAYLVAFVEVVALALLLSPGRHLTQGSMLAGVAACFVAAGVASVARRPRFPRARPAIAALRAAFRDPVLAVLAAVALAGLVYLVALALFTPQIDDDSLYYHLVRVAFWNQQHGVSYVSGTFDGRVNGNPPNAEIAMLFTMLLAKSDRFVGLVQLTAMIATTVGIYGISRRLGLGLRPALFGALLFPTLPVVALQASTALNDLIVASLLVVGVFFVVGRGRSQLALAGLAIALAVGAKFSAVFGVPLLAAAALLGLPRRRWRSLAIALTAGTLAGSYWFVVNLVEAGSLSGNLAGEQRGHLGPLDVLARASRMAIRAVDLPGAVGNDRYLYAVGAGALLLGGMTAASRRRRDLGLSARVLGATAIALLPLAADAVGDGLLRGYQRILLDLGRRDLAYMDFGGQATRATPMYSWYGPVAVILFVAGGALAIRAARRRELGPLAALLALAPVVALGFLAISIRYTEYEGRFLMFGVALSASTWGLASRFRPLAWGTAAIAATTLFLTLSNYEGKPSGLRLLERSGAPAVWNEPRWKLQAIRPGTDDLLRFVDEQIPATTTIGLAVTPSDFVYPYFGQQLGRTIRFVQERSRTVPPDVTWLVVRPGRLVDTRTGSWKVALRTATGWTIYQRMT
jgi:hypothetical protein